MLVNDRSVQLMFKHLVQGESFARVVLCLFSQCAAWLLIVLCSETVDFHLHNNGTKRWPANSRSLPQGVKAGRGDAKQPFITKHPLRGWENIDKDSPSKE